jgi:hypothetical protein
MKATTPTVLQPLTPASGDSQLPQGLAFWIRTPCGRAKYQQLAARPGVPARLRLGWFVLIAALRDLGRPLPQGEGDADPSSADPPGS